MSSFDRSEQRPSFGEGAPRGPPSFPRQRSRSGGKSLCSYYAQGRCKYGSSCKFIHEDGVNPFASAFKPGLTREPSTDVTYFSDDRGLPPSLIRAASNISMTSDDPPSDPFSLTLSKQFSSVSMQDGETSEFDSIAKGFQNLKVKPPVPLFSDSSRSGGITSAFISPGVVRNPNPNIGRVLVKSYSAESLCYKCGSIGTVYNQGDGLFSSGSVRLCWRCSPCLHCGATSGTVCAAGLCDTCYTPSMGDRLR